MMVFYVAFGEPHGQQVMQLHVDDSGRVAWNAVQ